MKNNLWMCCIAIVLVIFFICYMWNGNNNNKENWYFNDIRESVLYPYQYPSWWEDMYGTFGYRWPYRKCNPEFDQKCTHSQTCSK